MQGTEVLTQTPLDPKYLITQFCKTGKGLVECHERPERLPAWHPGWEAVRHKSQSHLLKATEIHLTQLDT